MISCKINSNLSFIKCFYYKIEKINKINKYQNYFSSTTFSIREMNITINESTNIETSSNSINQIT